MVSGIRWLLVKDLQILRRSPLLCGLLVVYPVVLAVVIGLALSSPPPRPAVAFYSAVPPGQGTITLGDQKLDVGRYTEGLLSSVRAIRVRSRAAAIREVRDGHALAAVIVPADLPSQVQSLVTQGIGRPTVRLYLNSRNPIERRYVDEAIDARIADVQTAVSKRVLAVAVGDLQRVLGGGQISLLGRTVNLLGLRDSRTIIRGTIASLPARSPLRVALGQVASFADLAVDGLGFAKPVLGSIGTPLTVQRSELSGARTPTGAYAAAISVVVCLMVVAMLLAAATLALERTENAWDRLVRGLVSPGALLAEKTVLAGGAGALVTVVMAAFVSMFVALDWGRFELWVAAALLAGGAFAAFGVLVGAIARDVGVAALMAFLLALPVAFVALVPAAAVSGGVGSALSAISFLFPFRPALDAIGSALTGAAPGIGLELLHLVVQGAVYLVLARVAVRRFADR